jgi:ABC-type sugar transport system ATPase subunit
MPESDRSDTTAASRTSAGRKTTRDPDTTGVTPAVSFAGVAKEFGATRALSEIEFELAAGNVHAFVGENGAGKSTCLGILAGRVTPTRGEVRLCGRELRYGDPRAARRAGVVAIYQELTIVPALSAQANVFLGQPLSRQGLLNERRMRARYVELCDELGVKAVADGVPAGSLSVAEQQLLEIMRARVADAEVILFDEPTASLALHERETLLSLMERLREAGLTIVFVSHNLDEVLAIADTVTVFRDGRITARGDRAQWDKSSLVHEMLGPEAGERVTHGLLEDAPTGPRGPLPSRRSDADPLLRVEGLTVPEAIEGVDFEVRAGEVVGLGGLVGSGRTTLLRALSGLEPRATGTLWIDGRHTPIPHTVRQAHRLGIALLPEDRKSQGLVLQMDAMNNVALSCLESVARFGVLSRRRMARETASIASGFGFRGERIGEVARNLSGGNQQKLLLARWRFDAPRLLLADEPTRGIDIGAKVEIIASLEAMAREGLGIVFVSSELEEVSAISHRVVVLNEGRRMGTLDRFDGDITPSRIMTTAFGLENVHAVAQ